jgi:hypothetical protein
MAYVSQEMKARLAPAIKSVLKRYGMKGTIAVRHHSTLVVTLRQGPIDFGGDRIQVNTYWVRDHYQGVARQFLTELVDAMKGPDFFDHSDIQTDYFHRSHYIYINVGKWNAPYALEK